MKSHIPGHQFFLLRYIPETVSMLFLATGTALSILAAVSPPNPWALFILFPGVILLGTGVILACVLGMRHPVALFTAGSGIVLGAVAGLFLLGAEWGTWWPLMPMAAGAALFLLGAAEDYRPIRPWIRMHLWLGADIFALGLVFLANNLAGNALLNAWHPFHWWGVFILLPGMGAFYNAADAVRSGMNGRHLVVRSLEAFGVAALAVALTTFLNAEWGLQIAAGLASAGIFLFL